MKDSLSFHTPIIYTGLKDLTPNIPLNIDDGPFCIQFMNVIQEFPPAREVSWVFPIPGGVVTDRVAYKEEAQQKVGLHPAEAARSEERA